MEEIQYMQPEQRQRQPGPSTTPGVRKHASLAAMAPGLESVQNPFFLQNS